jgi:hypothetical protein
MKYERAMVVTREAQGRRPAHACAGSSSIMLVRHQSRMEVLNFGIG